MHELARNTIFRTIDGDMRNLRLTAYLYHDCRNGIEIMNWLITHRYTGKNLYELQTQCDSHHTPWRLVAFVTGKLEKDDRPLYAGRDIL